MIAYDSVIPMASDALKAAVLLETSYTACLLYTSLGERHKGETELPILIKFIDAKKDLSVQVHPTDDYAKEHENGQRCV